MRWVPFVFGCFMGTLWYFICAAGHLSARGTIATSLLVGLMMDAWFQIPPRNLEKE